LFSSPADFTGAVFDCDARFDNVTFADDALFIQSEFNGIGAFDGARFCKLSALDGSVFFGNLSLGNAHFEQMCSLREASCLGGFWCDRTRFRSLEIRNFEVQGRTFARNARLDGQAKPRKLLEPTLHGWRSYGDVTD